MSSKDEQSFEVEIATVRLRVKGAAVVALAAALATLLYAWARA